jgi:ribosomal protein S18 acetylase RimI-like enzyme
MELEIRKVTSRKELKKFIGFQLELYKGNTCWCPPLIFDELNTLGKTKNPAFEYCEAEYWLAYRGNKIVGRIAGIINHKANQKWNEKFVRFGWIDFIDDIEVSEKLIDTVKEWGRSKGLTGIQGPLGFTDMDPEGMMIEGFNELSSLAAIYNYPYYPEHMVKLGFTKGADWVHFTMDVPKEIPEKVARGAAIVEEKYHLRCLAAKKAKDLLPYTKKMFRMLNDAFEDLYGYAALGDRQIDMYIKQYFGFIRPEFVSIILDDMDDVIAFGVTIPDMTHALQKCNGRIFPFGFIHLLWALKKNDEIHMYLIGVRPDYQGRGALAMVYNELHRAYVKHGIVKATTHAQLEDNYKAISIWKNYDSRIYIRRRCWEKKSSEE